MKRNKQDIRIVIKDGKQLVMSKDTYEYIAMIENKRDELIRENARLKGELESIKPVLAVGGMRPAVHSLCKNCRFVVISKWNGDAIGCNKDLVCEDFKPKGVDI